MAQYVALFLIPLHAALTYAANPTWSLIARDIGGGPLGVSCFEDGLTCVTATSQVLPAGYEVKRSLDGGVTWATVPDADLFIFGLDNQAVFGSYGIVSGDEFIQCSTNKGANFSQVPGSLALAGGEIARKLRAADGSWSGFAILGLTDDGNSNGLIWVEGSCANAWKEVNIQALELGAISTDGAFFEGAWLVVGEEYVTSEAPPQGRRRRAPTRKLRWEGGALVPTPPHALRKATFATQVVLSTDKGATWTTIYSNSSVATLGIGCRDATHCCLAQENANIAFIQCTSDGFKSVSTFTDATPGAALVAVGVTARGCFVVVGGAVSNGVQGAAAYRSCDDGATWAQDALDSSFPFGLLMTDVDCQNQGPRAGCWATLWDDSGIDPSKSPCPPTRCALTFLTRTSCTAQPLSPKRTHHALWHVNPCTQMDSWRSGASRGSRL